MINFGPLATKANLIVFLFLKDAKIKRLSFLNNILHKYIDWIYAVLLQLLGFDYNKAVGFSI